VLRLIGVLAISRLALAAGPCRNITGERELDPALPQLQAVIEARAKERHARERAEYEARMAPRDAKAGQTGKKPGGRVPQPPVEGPLPTDQVNLTDEVSRIMSVVGGGFEQCYNAQAAVAAGQPAGGGRRCCAGAERQAAA
jgi:hypothetical protein